MLFLFVFAIFHSYFEMEYVCFMLSILILHFISTGTFGRLLFLLLNLCYYLFNSVAMACCILLSMLYLGR